MLRKTLIALAAVAAVGVAAGTADARMGSGPVGGGGGHPGPSSGGGGGGAMQGPSSGSGMQGSSSMQGPTGKVRSFNTQSGLGPQTRTGNTWAGGPRHHHRHHNRFFGFAGPYYDYGYDSCWRIVPTYYGGWQRVWVCGDYPYWGY